MNKTYWRNYSYIFISQMINFYMFHRSWWHHSIMKQYSKARQTLRVGETLIFLPVSHIAYKPSGILLVVASMQNLSTPYHLCWQHCFKPQQVSPVWSDHLYALLSGPLLSCWHTSGHNHSSTENSPMSHHFYYRVKSVVLITASKALHHFVLMSYWIISSVLFHFAYSFPATPVSLLFFIISSHVSASGPLHLLFPNGTLFPQISSWFVPSLTSSVCSNIVHFPFWLSLFLIL